MTGTDEHGQKVANKAKEANKTPQKFVDALIPDFKEQLEKLNISYDYFLRTTNKDHKKFIQAMLQKAYDNGDIYKGIYEGLYCVDCEKYYTEDELKDKKNMPYPSKTCRIFKRRKLFFQTIKISKTSSRIIQEKS